jgi:histidyl-tRNA synthetase
VAGAPAIGDSLNDASRRFFDELCEGLTAVGVPFVVSPRLVRGLDYYSHTAFEFTTMALGAQGTVLAGGRYDGLIAQMGGPATPGIGWAAGIERLAMLATSAPPPPRPLAVVPIGDVTERPALILAQRLRRAGFVVDIGFSGNVGKRLKRANGLNACAAVLIGGDELARGTVTLRDLDSGDQREVPAAALEDHLGRYR